MLNGKFFTGLPPKMIDRGGTGTARNRLESHFFWPDDTKVDTAVESRIKRRNSVQLANTERPLYEKQTSMTDNIDVDTKKRFSKEFSQSSIQFYDNLNDNRTNTKRPIMRNSLGLKKMEIAEKPTKTKVTLPESVVDEAYTNAKKKQAYTSKIEFYDYVNEEAATQNSRNNLRKPKMDRNNKREVELNSKNSPKLQVKRDVRSLSEEKEQRKINNREVKNNESYNQRERERILNNEERYLQSTRSVEPRMNINHNYEQRYSNPREVRRDQAPLTYERRKPSYNESFEETRDYRRDTETPELYDNRRFAQTDYYDDIDNNNSFYRSKMEEPNRLRNNTKQYYDSPENREYSHEFQDELEVSNRMRTMHLKSPQPRKQYYPSKEYYDDEPQQYYRRNDQIKTPTNRGSSLQHFEYNDMEINEVDLPYENNNSNRRLSNGNRNSPINKINNKIQEHPVATPTSPLPSDTESSSTLSATKSQKHLRSSLCFNNGEIIGENDEAQSPTSSSARQIPTQRRNARSSATQRVSVGLPD